MDLVQGALVETVRNIHEGRRPATIERLYAKARSRIGSLIWASIVYTFGIVFGLILLVVPGLIVAARWCLTAPFAAHLLTVIYYRLKEPDRPVIHPDVRTWSSVWSAA